VSRQLAFVAGALPIVLVAVVGVALRGDTPTDQPQAPRPAPKAKPAGRDRPDVAVPPGRPTPTPAAEPGVPSIELGNDQLVRPVGPAGPSGVAQAARLFAGDWLEYLAGRLPVSAVRAADPGLLGGFAGGEAPEVGPGRLGLRRVRCRRSRGEQASRLCVAEIDGLQRLRFTVAPTEPGPRPRVTALALD